VKIGLVAAMYCEIQGIDLLLTNTKCEELSQFKFLKGNLGTSEVITVCCGIGLVNSALATQLLINHFSVECIINPGVAGALSNELNVCDVVISRDSTY
jgi:adenosylhomocysteine nucleosidase